MLKPTKTPWTYFFVRLLFKVVLKVFYGTIVIENEHYIPKNGEPVIVCANHTNSLTDALLLITSVSSKKRDLLKMTAKASQFGRRTFQSWLIESVGTIPLKRRMDHVDENVDNSDAMAKLLMALEQGDAVCLFPEGFSRYHPEMAPLKTGVARIASDVLSRNANNPDFGVTILTCSITYMHRQSFRSDVLVSFNPPIKLTVKDTPSLVSTPSSPVAFSSIRSLTQFMHTQLASNTIQSPTWDLIRVAKTAGRLYVPLGTRMGLGDWVRVIARFVEGFASHRTINAGRGLRREEKVDWEGRKLATVAESDNEITAPGSSTVPSTGSGGEDSRTITSGEGEEVESEKDKLAKDLRAYQNHVESLGLKDDRIRRSEGVPRLLLLFRLLLRLSLGCLLLGITIPGLLLWFPVFFTTNHFVRKLKASGPTWDTEDEVAQIKLIYGLASVCVVWSFAALVTLPFTFITGWLVPAVMWMTLRWTEDMVAAFRAAYSLCKLLRVGKSELKKTREWRKDLHTRVTTMAIEQLGLPEDPESVFLAWDTKLDADEELPSRWSEWTMSDRKDQKGRSGGTWDSSARYFSIRRRRKRDWNETLRWFDASDPKDE